MPPRPTRRRLPRIIFRATATALGSVLFAWAVIAVPRALFVTWLLTVLGTVGLYWHLKHRLRRFRRRNRWCVRCGYDLRATPDRCPECGTVPTAAPPAR